MTTEMKLEECFHLLSRPRRAMAESLPSNVLRNAVDYARTHRIQRARYGEDSWQSKNSYTVFFFYVGGVADQADIHFDRLRTLVMALESSEMKAIGRSDYRTPAV